MELDLVMTVGVTPTFVRAADALSMPLIGQQLLQEGRVLHCLSQEGHHLLLALLC